MGKPLTVREGSRDTREKKSKKLLGLAHLCDASARVLVIPLLLLFTYLVGVAILLAHTPPPDQHREFSSPRPRPLMQSSPSTGSIWSSVPSAPSPSSSVTAASTTSLTQAPTSFHTPTPSSPPPPLPRLDLLTYSGEDGTPTLQASVLHLAVRKRHVTVESVQHLANMTAAFLSRNVIVGAAPGIDARYLTIFCKSARAASPTAEIFLLIDSGAPLNRSHVISDILLKSRIHIVEFSLTNLQPTFIRSYHPSTQRWIFYHRIFTAYNSTLGMLFDRVVAVDVRDTHFSADPFYFLMPRGEVKVENAAARRPTESLVRIGDNMRLPADNNQSLQSPFGAPDSILTFKEENSPPIGECGWNAGWIRDCFGDAVLQLLSTMDISCSGLVMGKMRETLTYFRVMNGILSGTSNLTTRFPACERNGVDQGVHNVLLHMGLVPGLSLHNSRSLPGVVSHMQSDLYVTVDLHSIPPRVLNAAGLPVAIMHQFDRFAELQSKLSAFHVDWMDTGDWKAGWAIESNQCDKYHRLVDYDLLKGKCDFGSLRSLQPDMCCSACRRKAGCSAFTFAGGVCWLKKCSPRYVADAYINFTIQGSLGLSLNQYVAVADENNTPLGTLVVSALLRSAIDKTSVNRQQLLGNILADYSLNGIMLRVGGAEPATSDVRKLESQLAAYLPAFEKMLKAKEQDKMRRRR